MNKRKKTSGKKKYYVSMTDTFLSDWGGARGRIAKYVLICYSKDEVETVVKNARARGDMKNVLVHSSRPRYDPDKYQATFATKSVAAAWYKPNMGR